MTVSSELLLAKVLSLPHAERAEVVDQLVVAVNDEPMSAEWVAEIRRRSAELDQHPEMGIPAEEVFDQIRAKLRAKRA